MAGKRGIVGWFVGVVATAGLVFAGQPLAEVSYFSSGVEFSPNVWGHGFILKVQAPDGSVLEKTVKNGAPSFDLSEMKGEVIDGRYKFELRLIVSPPRDRRDAGETMKVVTKPRVKGPSLSGSFLVEGGSVFVPSALEPTAPRKNPAAAQGGPDAPAAVIADFLCVGVDCTSPEGFDDYETLKLKDELPGIRFEDTSVSPDPSTDWYLRANSDVSGGSSFFTLFDSDHGTMPLTIEAGATNNALYINDSGEVGLGTSLPEANLHIRDGDTPQLRFEQDTSEGAPAQTFLVGGNDSLFGIFDETGYQFPFIFLPSSNRIGFGTITPSYAVEVERTGVNSAVVVDRTDGATNYINATASFGNFGTVTNHPLRLAVNGTWQMRINNNSSITMANGASLTPGGVWTDASSRMLKQDIKSLSIERAVAALAGLEPVEFAYKASGERHVGFIAEDVPDLVAGADRNGLSPMDLVAVLTRVVQQQKEIIESQQQKLREKDRVDQELQATMNSMLTRISALESR